MEPLKVFSSLVTAVFFLSGPAIAAEPPLTPGHGATKAVADKKKKEKKYNVDRETFFEVFDFIKKSYVEEVSEGKLYYGAIDGMLSHLDPHSIYLLQEDFEGLTEHTKGEFGGLGLEVTQEHGVVKIVSPIDDTPAFAAGLKSGDYVIWIDEQPVLGMSLQEATDQMRGPKGTSVKLRIVREGRDPFDVTIKRDIIKVKPIKHRLEGRIGYIRISTFNEHTTSMLQQAVEDIKKQLKGELLGIVLDLRNNPGGVLEQAVAVSDLFLDEGEIVSVRYRDPQKIERYNASHGDIARGIPLAVLINGGSASGSEIVAGALQDHHRAIVMGNRSFGKGSVQLVRPVKGKKGAAKMTIARYYPPSGHAIQGNGITPDVIINQAKVEPIEDKKRREENLQGALKPLPGLEKENDKNHLGLENEKKKLEEEKPQEASLQDVKPEGAQPAKIPESESDYQLARSLDLLKAYAIFHHKELRSGNVPENLTESKNFFSILKR